MVEKNLDEEAFLSDMERVKKSANVAFYVYGLPLLMRFGNGRLVYYAFGNRGPVRFHIRSVSASFSRNDTLVGAEKLKASRIYFRLDVKHQIRATIIRIPGAEFEPEANYAAFVFYPKWERGQIKEKRYFTSEIYSDGTFGLCEIKDGVHSSHSNVARDIRTVDDMWNAIKALAVPDAALEPNSILAWHNQPDQGIVILVDFIIGDEESIEYRLKSYHETPESYVGDNGVHYCILRSKESNDFLLYRQGDDPLSSNALLEDREIALSLGKK